MARYISPFEQLLDDAGNPLAFGFLEFFEAGTTTEKVTFRDFSENQNAVHPQRVPLSAAGREPDIFYTGTVDVVLYTSKGTQIDKRLQVEAGGGSASNFSSWNSLRVYDKGIIVTGSDGNYYVSIITANQDNNPITPSPLAWTQIRFVRVHNLNEAYTINQIVEGTDGLLYSCVIANTGNDPVFDTVNWKPSTTIDVPAVVLAAGKTFANNNF